jgi:hypothetical protein
MKKLLVNKAVKQLEEEVAADKFGQNRFFV